MNEKLIKERWPIFFFYKVFENVAFMKKFDMCTYLYVNVLMNLVLFKTPIKDHRKSIKNAVPNNQIKNILKPIRLFIKI